MTDDVTPEQYLWQQVLYRAAIDATADNEPTSGGDAYAKRYARDWFSSGGRDFREVCSMAGLDPDFIHDAWQNRRIDARRLRAFKDYTVRSDLHG